MSADKKRLTICRCDVNDGIISVQSGDSNTFEVMLNPKDFKHNRAITYNKTKTVGQLGSDQKFSAMKPSTLEFKMILDGTGAIQYPGGGRYEPPSVNELLDKLKTVTYAYVGEKHEPSVVQVLWGDLIFYGRLTGQNVENVLFKPGGASLRAWVTLTFESFLSNEEEAKKANKSSPDLSHRVTFKAGDTLPLLCYRIYRDASYYTKVARANGLTSFRHIKPGTRIWFPPIH